MEIVTRKQAQGSELHKFYTGKPCKHGHLSERFTSNMVCVECNRKHGTAWAKANPEKAREMWGKASYKYRQKNKPLYAALEAKRRATMISVTPRWANVDEIKEIYLEAARRGMQVDHVVPLQSDFVCGLHVSANLRLLERQENQSKGNRWWPDMPS
jgi:5-methylcytosine-specific restriction endonuclease McrA